MKGAFRHFSIVFFFDDALKHIRLLFTFCFHTYLVTMLANKLFVELLGTFVFISVIFRYASKEWGAFAIGAALAVVVLFGGAISGGHFNPAVSLAMYVGNNINVSELMGYIVVQLIGGYAAWAYFAGKLAPGME